MSMNGATDEVVIKEEELEPDCVEVELPYVAIEAAIVDVEFDPHVPPEESHSTDLSEPAEYMSGQNELRTPECVYMSSYLGADRVSPYADVKEELVLETECITLPASHYSTDLARDTVNPILTDCWVQIERCEAAEKALKKQLAELYVREMRHTEMSGEEDFLCEKCKQNESYEFCKICDTHVRALNQLRNLRVNQRKTPFTCGLCCIQFRHMSKLYEHKSLAHGVYNVLQVKNSRDKQPIVEYLTEARKVNPLKTDTDVVPKFNHERKRKPYSCKECNKPASNEKLCDECVKERVIQLSDICVKKVRLDDKLLEARKVMPPKIDTDVVEPDIVPKLYERKRKPYRCKVCNKPASNEKLCGECVQERVIKLSDMCVKKVRLDDKFLDNKTVLKIEVPPRLHSETHQPSLEQQNIEKKTRECSVRLERCEAAELLLKIDAVKAEIIENTVMWLRKTNSTSDKSEEGRCKMCKAKVPVTANTKLCVACEKGQAENLLRALKMGFYDKK